MLQWNANFQIPRSGHQSAWVYLKIENEWKTEGFLKVCHYSEKDCKNLLWESEIFFEDQINNPYDYLMSLEQYQNYSKVT